MQNFLKKTDLLTICLGSALSLFGCGSSNAPSSSEVQAVECDRGNNVVATCGDSWKQWVYFPLSTGYFGDVQADGSRYSPSGDDRSRNWFVFGPYASLTTPGKISGGIELEANASIETNPVDSHASNLPGGARRWHSNDMSAQINAAPAFTVDMVAKGLPIGKRIVTYGEFRRNGDVYTFDRTSIGFSSPALELYQDIEIRIYDVAQALNIRAFKSYIRADTATTLN